LFDLTGRTALVTGSSRGIGLAIATGLAHAGATVVLNGMNPERLERSRTELAGHLGQGAVAARAFDVTAPDQVRDGVRWVENTVGPIEILVNNAGLQHREPLLDVSLEDWNRVLTADLTSAFLVGREVARCQLDRGHGKIINVCSVQTDLARPSIAAYTAAKGGLRNLTRAMTAEWAAGGLQINGIAPGYIDTEMTRSLVEDLLDRPGRRQAYQATFANPLCTRQDGPSRWRRASWRGSGEVTGRTPPGPCTHGWRRLAIRRRCEVDDDRVRIRDTSPDLHQLPPRGDCVSSRLAVRPAQGTFRRRLGIQGPRLHRVRRGFLGSHRRCRRLL
jgi:gluconate 5-dehydrogenase